MHSLGSNASRGYPGGRPVKLAVLARFGAPLRVLLTIFFLGALSSAAWSGALWPLGAANARLTEAGWRLNPRTHLWAAEVELLLVNTDPRRQFHRQVRVEFIDLKGHAWVWKTFVTLVRGGTQLRRIKAPRTLNCAGPVGACPGLKVRISLKKMDRGAGVQTIPQVALL